MRICSTRDIDRTHGTTQGGGLLSLGALKSALSSLYIWYAKYYVIMPFVSKLETAATPAKRPLYAYTYGFV